MDSGAYTPSCKRLWSTGVYSGAYAPKMFIETCVLTYSNMDSGVYAPSCVLFLSFLFYCRFQKEIACVRKNTTNSEAKYTTVPEYIYATVDFC